MPLSQMNGMVIMEKVTFSLVNFHIHENQLGEFVIGHFDQYTQQQQQPSLIEAQSFVSQFIDTFYANFVAIVALQQKVKVVASQALPSYLTNLRNIA